MVNTPQPAWHSKSVQDVIDDLKTHLEQGLSSDECHFVFAGRYD
ncbi:MAG: hypothetical protein HZC38_08630 [Chloroflexi bacterium]|nr:hypothetical protein [Chloroflexota bacterium]